MDPLVIEAALNGVAMPRANPHVPRSVPEIVAAARACLDAGATVVHHHAEEGLLDGRHSSATYAAAWREILASHPGAILYPTMGGGGAHTDPVERYRHVEELDDAGLIRMALVDPGSFSVGPLGDDGLPIPIDVVYQNTFADVRHMVDVCEERGLGVHVSVFEPGFLRVALAYHRAGRLPPAKIQLYFGGGGLVFGLPPTKASLDAYLAMMDGTGRPWMVGVIGGDVASTLAAEAIARGGHVRVGLEDWAGSGSPRNEELVAEIVGMAARAGRPVATPAEAARLFGLPPARAVGG
ncbi:MAG: 3-keto-5-aminohexanoate cleavage protein [Alphaproteobacteria bacterium]